jgi:hypothetical protein
MSNLFRDVGLITNTAVMGQKYTDGFFSSVSLMFEQGYAVAEPNTSSEMLLKLLDIFICAIAAGVWIGNIERYIVGQDRFCI